MPDTICDNLIRRLLGLLWALLVAAPTLVNAQSDTLAPPPIFSFGLIDGLNIIRLANGNTDQADHLLSNDSPKIGLDIGLSLSFAINQQVRLRLLPTVSFANLHYRIVEKPATGTFLLEPSYSSEISSLNLPLLVQVKKRQFQMLRPWFEGGMQPSIVLTKKASPNARRSPFGWGVVAGVGFDVILPTVTISPELRLVQSLTDFGDQVQHPVGQILPNLFAQLLSLQIGFE